MRVSYSMSYSLTALLQTRVVGGCVGGWEPRRSISGEIWSQSGGGGHFHTSTLLYPSSSSSSTQVTRSTRVPLIEEQLVQRVSLVAALGGSDTVVVHWLSTTPPADQVVPN